MAAHLSGFTPVTALRALAEKGLSTGGFHPLQTLPDPERGADALAGSFVGLDGDQLAMDTLTHLASSLGMEPFRLDDTIRPAYHAAAAAASNFVLTALATSGDLFDSAGVDPRVARPLVERAVANFYEQGPAGADRPHRPGRHRDRDRASGGGTNRLRGGGPSVPAHGRGNCHPRRAGPTRLVDGTDQDLR